MVMIHRAKPCDSCENGVYLPQGYYEPYTKHGLWTLLIMECPECRNRITDEVKHEDAGAWGVIESLIIEAGYTKKYTPPL